MSAEPKAGDKVVPAWEIQGFFDDYGDGCAAWVTSVDTLPELLDYLSRRLRGTECDAVLIRRGPRVEQVGEHEGCIGPYRLERVVERATYERVGEADG